MQAGIAQVATALPSAAADPNSAAQPFGAAANSEVANSMQVHCTPPTNVVLQPGEQPFMQAGTAALAYVNGSGVETMIVNSSAAVQEPLHQAVTALQEGDSELNTAVA